MFKPNDKIICIKGFPQRVTKGNIYVVEKMGTSKDIAAHGGHQVVIIKKCDQGHQSVRFKLENFRLYETLPEELFEL